MCELSLVTSKKLTLPGVPVKFKTLLAKQTLFELRDKYAKFYVATGLIGYFDLLRRLRRYLGE